MSTRALREHQKAGRPQLFLFGELEGAETKSIGVTSSFASMYCTWRLRFNSSSGWTLLEGESCGETFQSDNDYAHVGDFCTWNHPISCHLTTRRLAGWPRIELHVYGVDYTGRHDLVGYGIVDVPGKPGTYEMICRTWRPCLTHLSDRLHVYFCGGVPQFAQPDEALDPNAEGQEVTRFGFGTESSVRVFLRMTVVTKDFKANGLDVGEFEVLGPEAN
uniref:B9 domain-containing protein 2 n=1 Tax=Chromera velia CCMP2878 TaxID=1169474 RepID=A0A0G4FE09_9ALVE|mmetsp:Transcript_43093/g.84965  ORF Transcript_43093/g.84965 Transcript_43093/m.84965 type:complete len:218 (+) Transcript_43093:283-936(+)|eukprot:Cvel_16424.t1-p1 / transcript=Cvel_16424.t1 / gene=Cvel_16424 / organism=Chromera_velia_CCMP2878 / gene_product=B9 domain-containing protein 2, putative / transcript_product=B9 domain-containing protein 2, putative / location=Cvel_scaffold1265:14531-15181(-) / protein_length=217 / sequence_SO=supercontig / SO=protein_coding / is_pseudo=false